MASNNGSPDGFTKIASEKSSGLYKYARNSVDRVVSPSSRQQAWDATSDFANDRPVLFTFIVAQLLFSFIPILLFTTFSLSTVVFALGTALVFSLFWIGVAFMGLVPTLLVTSSIAVLVWAWGYGSFIIAQWLYNHAPIGVRETTNGVEIVKNENGTK